MTAIVKRISAVLLRLPIRWRLALTSAALTFLILTAFAVVVGAFTAKQVRDHFDDDLRATVGDLATRVRAVEGNPPRIIGINTLGAAATGDAVVRVLVRNGEIRSSNPKADVGAPAVGLRTVGHYRVISRPIFLSSQAAPVAWIQYAKPRDSTNGTLDRIRLFLAVGVIGGALLALLAGLAVAGRAMGPVKRLTLAAKEIARTRDAAVTLPKPAADDEVADLARTLEEMLRELDAARAELEALLKRQREFVADASHELRTPLTSILANLELLEDALEGEDAEIVESALRSSRRMRGLVSDLLLLARADAQRERTSEVVDLSEVVLAAVSEVAPLASAHDLSVDVPDRVMVEAWRDDLHRLVLNLVENALRHTPPGTAVRVRTRDLGSRAELVVDDEGPGLPAHIRAHAFERFVRGGGDGGRGSGLGLSIVSAVAQGHGGEVDYADRDGGGSRFTVRLPAMVGTTPPRRRAGSSAGA